MKQTLNHPSRLIFLSLIVALTLLLLGCSKYSDKVSPVALPQSSKDHVNIRGALLTAESYVDEDEAENVFGFDIRSAGLLPVRLVIDNQSGLRVEIQPDQTFLIDRVGQAWPLLTQNQAFQRVKDEVEVGETLLGAAKPSILLGAAGAVAGFAIGILTGENLGTATVKGAALGASAGALYGGTVRHMDYGDEIRKDLLHKALRNQRINPGQLAYGYLFFPGKEEAESAIALRLAIRMGGEEYIQTIPLFQHHKEKKWSIF